MAGIEHRYEKLRNVFFALRMSRILGVHRSPANREGDGDFVVGRANLVDVVESGWPSYFSFAWLEVAGRRNDTAQPLLGLVVKCQTSTVALRDQVGPGGMSFRSVARTGIVGTLGIPYRP